MGSNRLNALLVAGQLARMKLPGTSSTPRITGRLAFARECDDGLENCMDSDVKSASTIHNPAEPRGEDAVDTARAGVSRREAALARMRVGRNGS